MKEKNNIKEKEKTMNEKMKNELNVMLSDDMLAEINGGVGGGIGFPNQEVEEGFIKYLAPFYLDNREANSVVSYTLINL